VFGAVHHARVAGAAATHEADEPLRRLRRVIQAEAERQRLLLGSVQTAGISLLRMIRIAIAAAAFGAIKATLPVGTVAFEAKTNGQGRAGHLRAAQTKRGTTRCRSTFA
jgi:hypothetical protein